MNDNVQNGERHDEENQKICNRKRILQINVFGCHNSDTLSFSSFLQQNTNTNTDTNKPGYSVNHIIKSKERRQNERRLLSF